VYKQKIEFYRIKDSFLLNKKVSFEKRTRNYQ